MSLGRGFETLREQNFRLLFVARSVSTFGTAMATPALAFAVLKIGTPTDLGLVILAREIPIVVLLLLGGVWGDRVPRHLLLVVTDVVRGGAQATTALLLLTGKASVLDVALLQIVFGGATAFGRPAFQGLVPQLVDARDLQPANALLGLSSSVFTIVGPALGALITTVAQPGWALGVDALTFGISALLTVRMALPRSSRVFTGSVLADFREGWREVVCRSWLVWIIAAFGLFQLTYFPALLVLGPYVAKTDLGGPIAWGAILACEAAGSLVGGFVALRVRFSRPLVATMLLVVPAGVQVVLLGVGAPLWAIAAASFVSGICMAVGGAVWFATVQEKIPEHAISRVSSFDWFGSVALNPIGYAVVGPLSQAIGVGETLVVAGALNLVCTAVILGVPSVRGLRAGPDRAPVPEAA